MKKSVLLSAVLIPAMAALTLLQSGCTKVLSTGPLSAAVHNSSAAVYTPSQADNMVGSNLYNYCAGQGGNVLFSPFSIITALAMAQEGAVGPTQTQMQSALYLNPNNSARWTGFQQLLAQINAQGKSYTLATADNLWPQQGFTLEPAFLNVLETYYDAGVTDVDFGDPAGAAQTIDGAVSQETDGYIPQLLTAGQLNANTELVLTNAVYFQANWLSQFATTGTYSQTFTPASGGTESVSMMHQTLSTVIGNFNGAASVIALPYSGLGASMYILLPPPGGMSALQSQMTGTNINSWLAANASAMTATGTPATQVTLSLPKFTFSTNYDLTKTLSAEMPLAFTPPGGPGGGANFSGIDGHQDLYISDVVHQAFINVNEAGTTAAAATAVIVGMATAVGAPIPFTVDHPFLFMIVDNPTDTVLFLGQVNDPLASN